MIIAAANGWPSGSLTATRIEPTSAVPSDEPRLDTHLDSPEMSPCSASGKLDCTRLTEDVSMIPVPAPSSSNPGIQVQIAEWARTSANSSRKPMVAIVKPAITSQRCGCRRANRSAPAEEMRITMVDGVSSNPVLIAL